MTASQPNITAALAAQLDAMRLDDLPPEAAVVARQCLLDWMGVTLAARQEPLVGMLTETAAGPDDGVSLFGQGRRAPLDAAVLINGAASHALDFDDVLMSMGHPSAPVVPVVLGLAEQLGAGGAQVLEAFIVGVEAELRVARFMGASHYATGWHGTGTFGAFGAAAAACRLLGVEGEALVAALGLAGTQAAGLKAMFGTMAKPLHAGKAAQNGLLAARLAARGFTSHPDILGVDQGFGATQSSRTDPEAALAQRAPGVVDILFKYHAACYLTHNAIEAAGRLRRDHGVHPDDVAAATISVGRAHMGVCNITEPATGLECKFSLAMTVAMALTGDDTSDEALFSDTVAARPDLVMLRRRMSVEPTAAGASSTVEVRLRDGRVLLARGNVLAPERDLTLQQEKIERKFVNLAGRALGASTEEVIGMVREVDARTDMSRLFTLCRDQAARSGVST